MFCITFRFCKDCKSKVARAFGILVDEIDPSEESGYCRALYAGLRFCGPKSEKDFGKPEDDDSGDYDEDSEEDDQVSHIPLLCSLVAQVGGSQPFQPLPDEWFSPVDATRSLLHQKVHTWLDELLWQQSNISQICILCVKKAHFIARRDASIP